MCVGLLGVALIVVPRRLRRWLVRGRAPDHAGRVAQLVARLVYLASADASPGSFVATVIEMLAGGLVLLILGSALGEWSDVTRETLQPGPIAAWAYLEVAGSIGFTAYAWLREGLRRAWLF